MIACKMGRRIKSRVCGLATTATSGKRYLPNGLVPLLQSIEASVARRPLGLQLGWRFRGEPSFRTTHPMDASVPIGAQASLDDTLVVTGVASFWTFLCKSVRYVRGTL